MTKESHTLFISLFFPSKPEAMIDEGSIIFNNTSESSSTVLSETRFIFLIKNPNKTRRKKVKRVLISVSKYIPRPQKNSSRMEAFATRLITLS